MTEKKFRNVTGFTRAKEHGRLIYCPYCDRSQRVYNFFWKDLLCLCGRLVPKEEYKIEVKNK
jgi:hypothetical protein